MLEIIESILGHRGRLISGSKSMYHHAFPRDLAVFNANLIVDGKKVWYGDINITKDVEKLKEIALKIGKPVFILSEMAARFDTENSPKVEEFIFKTDGIEISLGKVWEKYYDSNSLLGKEGTIEW